MRDEARYEDSQTGEFDERAWKRDSRKDLKSSQKKDGEKGTEESRARRGKEQR